MQYTVESLQAEEQRLVAKFQARADRLQTENPNLSRSIAIAKAAEALPVAMNKYLNVRAHLVQLGVPSLPLE
jgi:hypothetical protein